MYEIYVFGNVGCYEEELCSMGFDKVEWYWHCTVEHGEVGKITNMLNLCGLRYYVLDHFERLSSQKWWKKR